MRRRFGNRQRILRWMKSRKYTLIVTTAVILFLLNLFIFLFFSKGPRKFYEEGVERILNTELDKNQPYLKCHPNQRFLELEEPYSAFLFDSYIFYPGGKIGIFLMSYYFVDRGNYRFKRPPYQLEVTFVDPSIGEEKVVCNLNDCDLYENECLSNIYICDIPTKFQSNSKKALSIKLENDKKIDEIYEVQNCAHLPSYEFSISVMVANSVLYIDEWMKFHHFVGFEHVYLYCIKDEDDTCNYADERFGDYVTTFRVEHLPYAIGSQFFTFADASYRYRRNTWIALHDSDEFPIYIPNIRSFTNQYSNSVYNSLQIRQVLYDSEGYDYFEFERMKRSNEKFWMMKIFKNFSPITGILFPKAWRYEERRSKVLIQPSKSYYGGIHMYCSKKNYKTKSIELNEAYFNHYFGKEGVRTLEFPYKGHEEGLKDIIDYFEVISPPSVQVMRKINRRYVEILENCEMNGPFCGLRELELNDPMLLALKKRRNIETKKVFDRSKYREEEMREFTCPIRYCCPDENGEKYVSVFEEWYDSKLDKTINSYD